MPDSIAPDVKTGLPYLEHYPEPGGIAQRIELDHFPFRIGRCSTANFVVYSRQVSKEHAEVIVAGEEFRIRDAGSTNGTFVNGQRVVEAPLNNGDIVHVAHKEFRFGSNRKPGVSDSELKITEQASTDELPANLLQMSGYLRDLIAQSRVTAVFQPIVRLDTGERVGYEALGRGTHDKLSPNPKELFYLAEKCKLAKELSRLFRRVAVREAVNLPNKPFVFYNFHPWEIKEKSYLDSLQEHVKNLSGQCQMVLEVHEDCVANVPILSEFRDELRAMDIRLAYDDFGSGQARLTELTDCPPDFIKLDFKLVREIHKARPRQEIIRALGRVCNDLGVQIIAEGVESQEEADVCLELGCHWSQGFLFGQPQPVATFAPKKKPDTRRLNRNQLLQRLKSLQS
jgi:EAL domain-containing protein (putative c-di-GMP-specific phosphodiesterase class I)